MLVASRAGLDQLIDPLLDGARADHDAPAPPRLADAVGAIGCLILDGRVPPAIEVEDVAGVGQVEPRPRPSDITARGSSPSAWNPATTRSRSAIGVEPSGTAARSPGRG
jgi:hypothetical protein